MATDLSTPSFAAAYHLSRQRALSGDTTGAARLFSRLLWHVEASEGGFIGLTDEQLFEKCENDKRLNHAAAAAALYAPGPWPTLERTCGQPAAPIGSRTLSGCMRWPTGD